MIDIVIVVCITIIILVKLYFVHRCEHEYEILKELKVTEVMVRLDILNMLVSVKGVVRL
ncbi:MAG: hypothetical protein ACRCXT_23825 [Paraclostridium sp.]